MKNLLLFILIPVVYPLNTMANLYSITISESGHEIKISALNDSTHVNALVIYKLKSGKTFSLPINSKVRVYCIKRNGMIKLKSARITKMQEHQINFKPHNKHYEEITYADSTLDYLEFANFYSVSRGIVVNSLLIGSIAVIVGAIMVVTIYTILESPLPGVSWAGSGWGGFVASMPWDNFHKHIKIQNYRRIKKWGVRID